MKLQNAGILNHIRGTAYSSNDPAPVYGGSRMRTQFCPNRFVSRERETGTLETTNYNDIGLKYRYTHHCSDEAFLLVVRSFLYSLCSPSLEPEMDRRYSHSFAIHPLSHSPILFQLLFIMNDMSGYGSVYLVMTVDIIYRRKYAIH